MGAVAYFCVEGAALCFAHAGYFLSFYFWLDAVATASLLFDIPAVYALLAPAASGANGSTLTQFGRTAAAGASVGQILRLVRIVRVVSLMRAFECTHSVAWRRRGSPGGGGSGVGGDGGSGGEHPSLGGSHRSDSSDSVSLTGVAAAVHAAPGQRRPWGDDIEGGKAGSGGSGFGASLRSALALPDLAWLRRDTARVAAGPPSPTCATPRAGAAAAAAGGGSAAPPRGGGGARTGSARPSAASSARHIEARGRSRVGARLSDLTTRRVIAGVWTILLASPLFTSSLYPSAGAAGAGASLGLTFQQGGIAALHSICSTCVSSAAAVAAAGGGSGAQGGGGGASSPPASWAAAVAAAAAPPAPGNASSSPQHPGSPAAGDAASPFGSCLGSSLFAADLYAAANTPGLLAFSMCGADMAPRYGLPGVPPRLRKDWEVSWAASEGGGGSSQAPAPPASTSAVDARWPYELQHILNIARTLFLSSMLGAAVLAFSRDAERLVLQPLERMVMRVEAMTDNPLQVLVDAAKQAGDSRRSMDERRSLDEKALAGGALSRRGSLLGSGGFGEASRGWLACVKRGAVAPGGGAAARSPKKAEEDTFETRILELSINKICALMALGFGEAGAAIIAENMRTGGAINPMIPGRKVMAIFGFCDIRNFTAATEVLQADVMEFVNTIAQVVHSECARRGGAANKNVGDAFLLVWKFPPHVSPEDVAALAAGCAPSRSSATASCAAVADKALAAFGLINASLRRSAALARFCAHPGLAAAAAAAGAPGGCYSVRMGFGLHVGWAIEGAIGSEFKVDASYLSPHVNTAARLEAATKQYGVGLLASEQVARLLSQPARRRVRRVDTALLCGAATPGGLVTLDGDAGFIAAAVAPQPAARRGGNGRERAQSRHQHNHADHRRGGSSERAEEGRVAHTPRPRRLSGASVVFASPPDEPSPQPPPTRPPPRVCDGFAPFASPVSSRSGAPPPAEPPCDACDEALCEVASHPDFAAMAATLGDGFAAVWDAAFDAYSQGRWEEAAAGFRATLHARVAPSPPPTQHPRPGGPAPQPAQPGAAQRDGPSAALLAFMEGHGWVAPPGWAGWRALADK